MGRCSAAVLFASCSTAWIWAAVVEGLACLDEEGNDVDYAYTFKYPGGFDYTFLDARVSSLAPRSTALDGERSSVSRTLMQLQDEGVSFVLWNDEPPSRSPSGAPYAHAKGVLAFAPEARGNQSATGANNGGGFWLTHSLPLFPAEDAQSAEDLWSAASHSFGQAFLCVSLSEEEVHRLSPAMLIERPTVYSHRFVGDAESKFADIAAWATGHKHDADTMTLRTDISSRDGQRFTLFSKSGAWGLGRDLYRDLVAPAAGPLLVEVWRRGRGNWGPACGGGGSDEVLDVERVAFPGASWNTTEDHSKWAVTASGATLCVGDLNRAAGQDKRGGGTVCIEQAPLAEQLRGAIAATDACPSSRENRESGAGVVSLFA